MPTPGRLPFQPIRDSLYSSTELMTGFDRSRPDSMAETIDFRTFVYFVVNGRAAPHDPHASMMEALHDNSILQAMFAFLRETGKPTAAIMGGHKEERGSPAYAGVAEISRRLTDKGYLMASGGGPGAMEATHVGAMLSGQTRVSVDEALAMLATQPKLPDSSRIVDKDGNIDYATVAEIHKWAVPAVDLLNFLPNGGASLAVPTWHYGHEPLTPLATQVAKYFLNSIREDVLLALATNGIIFAPGKAGTLQEVFQDAAQNYYRGDAPFSPMVFYGKGFWRDELPIEPLLEALFVKNGREKEYREKVRFLDDIDEIVEFLCSQNVKPAAMMVRFEALGMAPLLVDPS